MLIIITLSICGTVVILLFLETSIPYLLGSVVRERDSEMLYGRDVSTTAVCSYIMYCDLSSIHLVPWNKSGILHMGLL